MNKISGLKIVEKMKIWLVALLVLIVAGSVVWGVAGLNKDSSYKGYKQLAVNVTSSIAAEDIKKDTEKWLDDNGVKVVSVKVIDEQSLIYEVETKMTDDDVKDGLKTALGSYEKYLDKDIPVNFTEAKGSANNTPALWALLAIGVSLVVLFVYALIRYKWRRALTLVASILLSIYLTICLTAIFRIPVGVNYISAIAFAFVFSGIVSLYYVNKVKALVRSAEYKGAKRIDLANSAVSATLLKTVILAVATIIILVAGVIFSATPVRYVLLSAIVGVVVSTAVVLTVTPTLYAYLGKGGVNAVNNYTPKVIAGSESSN